MIGREITITGTERKTIRLTHRGDTTDADVKAEIMHEPSQDHQLLPVLFTQHHGLGSNQRKQPCHNSGDTIEMPRATAPTEGGLQ